MPLGQYTYHYGHCYNVHHLTAVQPNAVAIYAHSHSYYGHCSSAHRLTVGPAKLRRPHTAHAYA